MIEVPRGHASLRGPARRRRSPGLRRPTAARPGAAGARGKTRERPPTAQNVPARARSPPSTSAPPRSPSAPCSARIPERPAKIPARSERPRATDSAPSVARPRRIEDAASARPARPTARFRLSPRTREDTPFKLLVSPRHSPRLSVLATAPLSQTRPRAVSTASSNSISSATSPVSTVAGDRPDKHQAQVTPPKPHISTMPRSASGTPT